MISLQTCFEHPLARGELERQPSGVTERAGVPPRGLWSQVVDIASVASFAVIWIALAAQLADSASGLELLAAAAVALPAGYLAADLASGLVHWFADSFFDETTPFIGPLFIEPFREHHRDPQGITRHGFFEITGNSCMIAIPPLAIIWLLGLGASDPGFGVFGVSFALCTALGVFATNQIHSWAHLRVEDVPRGAARLQRAGLILSAEHHSRHHDGTNDRAYCVTSGWLNPLLDRFDVFARLAHWIRGMRPGAHA